MKEKEPTKPSPRRASEEDIGFRVMTQAGRRKRNNTRKTGDLLRSLLMGKFLGLSV